MPYFRIAKGPSPDLDLIGQLPPDKDVDGDMIQGWISRRCAGMDDSESNQIDLFQRDDPELISKGNKSSGNASTDPELSRYPICNIVAISRQERKIPEGTRSYDCIKYSTMHGMREMPEQVLFDILLRLPVVSLLWLKLVCKSWCALIESSTFITQHFHHNCNKDNLVARYNWIRYNDYNFCMLSGSKYEEFVNLEFDQNWHPVKEMDIVDSCNGIICLQHQRSGDVALWNPAMKQLRLLPDSAMCHQPYELLGGSHNSFDELGFGFDVKSNDYKVVRIITSLPEGVGYDFNQVKGHIVQVYSLKTNYWRTIHEDDAVLPFWQLTSSHAKSKNGTCFWRACDDDQYSNFLLSFDLKNETFDTMPLPGDDSERLPYVLDFLNDKLAYIIKAQGERCQFMKLDTCFEVWVLDEYGVKESWRKMYKIGPIGYGITYGFFPVGFSKNGEFLLLSYGAHCIGDHGRLYLYDLWSREEKYLRVQKPNPFVHQFIHYNESLVSIIE